MATPRDFVYDAQGEMIPSDSAAAEARRKELDDDARMVSDAKESARAPAVKMPTRPGQGAAKPKAPVVTKEQLAKSGFTNLRDYMNKQQGKTRRDGKAPEQKTPESQKPATPINRARPTPEGSTPTQYGNPAYMRNLMREDMEKERAEIQPKRREEQKANLGKYTRPDEASMKKGGSVRGAGIAQRGVRKCKMI